MKEWSLNVTEGVCEGVLHLSDDTTPRDVCRQVYLQALFLFRLTYGRMCWLLCTRLAYSTQDCILQKQPSEQGWLLEECHMPIWPKVRFTDYAGNMPQFNLTDLLVIWHSSSHTPWFWKGISYQGHQSTTSSHFIISTSQSQNVSQGAPEISKSDSLLRFCQYRRLVLRKSITVCQGSLLEDCLSWLTGQHYGTVVWEIF